MKSFKAISVLGAGLCLFLFGLTSYSFANEMSGGNSMTENLKPLKGKQFEISFLKEMIEHHQSAVDMANLVNDHTNRPELKKMANDIVSTQKKEIDQMKSWLANWYKEQPEAGRTGSMGMMKDKMEKLENSKGDDFDRHFIETMIEHHQQAVEMSKLVPQKADHSELKVLGNNIIKAQSKEIEEMKKWRKTWF